MDFNNVSELLNGMKEYYDSHDIRNSSLFVYDAYKVDEETDPRIKSLIDKDKYGEYIGRCMRDWLATDGPGQPKINDITVYLKPDGHIAGVWNSIGGFSDSYEVFFYRNGYYTGAMYSVIGNFETNNSFTYYIVNDEGKVTEMINIYGGMVALTSQYVTITKTVLDYDGDETIMKSSEDYRYKKTDKGYELFAEEDNMDESFKDEDRVIDNQKALCKKLKKAVKSCSTLEEIVNTFFDIIKTAKENPEEEISYTAGANPFAAFMGSDGCMFNLMRWTPTEDDEYYQLSLDVVFEELDIKVPYDNMNDVEGADALKKDVLNSESFKALKDKKIRDIVVEVIET